MKTGRSQKAGRWSNGEKWLNKAKKEGDKAKNEEKIPLGGLLVSDWGIWM